MKISPPKLSSELLALKSRAESQAIYDLSRKYTPILFGASFALILAKPKITDSGKLTQSSFNTVIFITLFLGLFSTMLIEFVDSYGKIVKSRDDKIPVAIQIACVLQLLIGFVLFSVLFDAFFKT